jgi:hypothetical protein
MTCKKNHLKILSSYLLKFIGQVSDIWINDITSGLWTWMGGPAIADTFGIYNHSGKSIPGGRSVSVTWTDANNQQWMFGGWGLVESPAAGM